MLWGLQARLQALGSGGFWMTAGRTVRAADAGREGTHSTTQVLAILGRDFPCSWPIQCPASVLGVLAALVRGRNSANSSVSITAQWNHRPHCQLCAEPTSGNAGGLVIKIPWLSGTAWGCQESMEGLRGGRPLLVGDPLGGS